MLPYAVFLVMLAIFGFLRYFVFLKSEKAAHRMACVAFAALWLLLALRSPYMGIDLGYQRYSATGYLPSFHALSAMPFLDIITLDSFLNYEKGYIVFNNILGMIWENEQFFMAVCALVSLLPVWHVVSKCSEAPLYSCLIYFALPVYEILFSGLRQGIAVGICFLSILAIQERKPGKFLFLVALASLFHDSCLVFLVAYPVYHTKLSKSIRLVSILLVPLTYLFRVPLVRLYSFVCGTTMLPDYNSSYEMLILLVMIYFVCSLFVEPEDSLGNGCMNLFLICCMAQSVSTVYSSAIRMGYYFMIPVILILPQVLNKMEFRLRVVAKWIVIAFFTFFAIYRIFGSSWSGMYPYRWFWQT